MTTSTARPSPETAERSAHRESWRIGAARSRQRAAASRAHHTRGRTRLLAPLAAVALVLTGCSHSDPKSYDISPIFPLSTDKCAKYDGKAEGSGLLAHCYVTKDKCLQAAADWRQAMSQGGVGDAIQFSCN